MQLSVTTWNINSVRLRIAQVRRFIESRRPDVLCLQETKCPDDRFPLKDLQSFGYPFVSYTGQKGYNGVAILSKFPFSETKRIEFCGRTDARHVAVRLAQAKQATGVVVHNFYVPAGGDVPDPDVNEKFRHKLQFLQEMRQWSVKERPAGAPAILVGDLNVAPYEHDVWSHKQLLDVVSHTPIETESLETLRDEGGWTDAMRHLRPQPEKVFSWWSYRSPDWQAANKGRRLDHVWVSGDLSRTVRSVDATSETRSWERPSDHVPVTAVMEL